MTMNYLNTNRPSRPCAVAAGVLAMMLSAACGSTVQGAHSGGLAQPGQLPQDGTGLGAASDGTDLTSGVSPDGADGTAGIAPDGSMVTGGQTGSLSGTAGGSGTGSASTGGTAGASGPGGPPARGAADGGGRGVAAAPGVTASEVRVGITYFKNKDAANAALGVAKISGGDPEANFKAVINDINRRGGVAGRKLVPVFHAYDAQSTQTRSALDQAACEDFTKDRPVFAVIGKGTGELDDCVIAAGRVVIDANSLNAAHRPALAKLAHSYEVAAPALDRSWETAVPALGRNGYFGAWDTARGAPGAAPVKVGVLTFDRPDYVYATDRAVLPELVRLGHKVDPANVIRIAPPSSAGEVGATVSQFQGAVLKFRQNQVTHVVLMDSAGDATLLFTQPAENQQYRPRYGVTSANALQALLDAGIVPPEQLGGATGFGWNPILDLPAKANPLNGAYSNPARRYCRAVLKAAGQNPTSTNADTIQASNCDVLYFLRDVTTSIRGPITRDSFRLAVEALGSGFTSANAGLTLFGAARHDGPRQGYDLTYERGCNCITYVGPRRIIG